MPQPSTNTNALDKKPEKPIASLVKVGERGIVLQSFQELYEFAALAVKHGAAPKGMTAGAAAIAIQAGLERGLGILGGLQQVVVVNGVISWRGQGAFALIVNSGLCKPGTLNHWVEGEGGKMKGVAEGWRVGYPRISRSEFSWEDARRAGLLGNDNYKKYPQRQVRWRAFGFLGKDVWPDVLGGFPIEEEAKDYTHITNVPQQREDPPKPSMPDPLLDAIEGKLGEVVGVEIPDETSTEVEQPTDPDGSAAPAEVEQPSLLGDSCRHGAPLSLGCGECGAEKAEAK